MSRPAQRFISEDIRRLVRGGYPQKQAIAIAYSQARRKGYRVPARGRRNPSPVFAAGLSRAAEAMAVGAGYAVGDHLGRRALRGLGARRIKTHSNPTLMTVFGNPPKRKATMRREAFERTLAQRGSSKEKAEYRKAVLAYKRFHGMLPKTISREVISDGKKQVTGSTFLVKIGKAPDTTYKPVGGSKKGQVHYKHDWKNKPDVLATPDGKTLILKLRGNARVADWLRG